MMYLALFHHLMVTFTYARLVERNCTKIAFHANKVCNMLEVCELPKEFRDIRRLERVFVARQLLFKKINIMSKGQFPKLKGALCNIPIDVVDDCNTLPRLADSNGIKYILQ